FDELEIDKKKPFRFKVEFEVVPDFKLLPPSTFKLKEKPVKVSKEDVDARLDDLRRARASLEDKGQEKAQSGDVVTFDYKGTLDGEVFQGGTAENQQMEIGSNNYLPDFASQFDDIKAGEEKTFPLTFPKDYGEPTLAGKQVEFSIKVKKVERKVLPEMNKEFFSQVGKFETEQEVREHLSEQLRGEKEAGQKQELHDELTEQIRKKYDFDVPETLAQQMLERFQHNLSHQDPDAVMDEKKFNKRSEEELENIKANLRLTYVFDKVSEENGIKADQEVVRQRFFMQSYMMRQNPTDLIKTEAGNRLIYQIEQAAIGEKVLDHLVAQVLGKSGSSDKGSPEAGETADKPAKKKPAGKKPTEKK
ncbi:MAG: trigger factor, partial [Deltaproteobacteria bacterium]|nr:trigger factor [Deltaproteobacteria bacterium]